MQQSTESHRAPLARRPIPTGISPQLEHRRRRNAFVELFTDAVRKPAAIYALTRKEPRCQLPDEKQRALIHKGIRDGVISRARVIRYRASQLLGDFAQFPDEAGAIDVLYVQAMVEVAEMVEAQTIARAMPTEGNRDVAVRESREAVAVVELHCAALSQWHPLPRGATPR